MIYLARHGQTVFNREGRLQGHVDSDLTELGLAQARRMGQALKGLVGDARGWRIVASPLGRAQATAQEIALALGLPEVETEPRLIEVSWGEWDGRARSEIQAAWPEAFGDSGWSFRAPTGESYDAVAARLGDWLADLPPEPQRRLIAVSHGVSGRVLRGLYGRLPREEALNLPVPQDAVFRLRDGSIARIDC